MTLWRQDVLHSQHGIVTFWARTRSDAIDRAVAFMSGEDRRWHAEGRGHAEGCALSGNARKVTLSLTADGVIALLNTQRPRDHG